MRRTTKEERELFHTAVTKGLPVKTRKSRSAPPVAVPAKKASPPKSLGGIDGNTSRRLKRGEIEPDARLDLHGMTEAAAYRALTAFVAAAHKRGARLALVVTGKGGVSADPERARGVLKAMVPRWLEEAPLKNLIADKRGAHIRHGGDGALYVYLRKAKG